MTEQDPQREANGDAWGGWMGYWCEWCGGYQFVPGSESAEGIGDVHPALTPGEPVMAGRRWVCIGCHESRPWPASWTEHQTATRRVA